MKNKIKEYALYRGDEFLMIGTKKECAKYLKVKEQTIDFYATPKHWKRTKGKGILAYRFDDEEDKVRTDKKAKRSARQAKRIY